MSAILAVANEKGGVGKTTTAVNLAAGLALRLGADARVLLVDMDPQGHALLALDYEHCQAPAEKSTAALLVESPPPSLPPLLRRARHHHNLFFVPGNRPAMLAAARSLPGLMANESRLERALAPVREAFAYIIIDTPPNTGDLLVNALVASTHVLVPVETSYLGVSGLRELQRTLEEVRRHFHPDLEVLGILPTLCEEQRAEAGEILRELRGRFDGLVLDPIHRSTDLAYAHANHMDVFTYRPPRQRAAGQLASSSRATQEYARLVELVMEKCGG